VLGFLNWVVALGPLLTGFMLLVGLWITYLGLRVVLNWVRVL
jgi:hypothetical protein